MIDTAECMYALCMLSFWFVFFVYEVCMKYQKLVIYRCHS